MEMQIKHFSHEHPLSLKDVVLKAHETEIICKCCKKSISNEQAYGCYECGEDYFLHKKCAQLPREIMHPEHKHYLFLLSRLSRASYRWGQTYYCNKCHDFNFEGFTYHCSLCEFDLDVSCALNYTFVDLDRERARNMEMLMEHFSHEHPLILRDVVLKDHETEILCKCCQKSISSEVQAYGCYVCSKDYFLHKLCAQLPREILHHTHNQHSLVLLSRLPYTGLLRFNCNECRKNKTGFTYHCSLCEFDLDVSCAVKDDYALSPFVDHGIKHDGHRHSLIFHTRPALFRCDACGVEDRGQFYQCLSCPFYIHKSCASLPITGKREDHGHTLSLAYNLPSEFSKFRYDCAICSNKIMTQYWVYYCRNCRYLVHLKCMTSKTKEQLEAEANSNDDLLDDTNFEEKLLKVLLDDDLLHLPATDLSGEMIKRFLLRKNKLANIQLEIRHWNHEEHPMILVSQNDNEIEEDEQILCNCCIEPVSAPYYSCAECGYFLHLPCANLPKTLKHSSHPHTLELYADPKFYHIFHCNTCKMMTNGIFYVCNTCQFFLDVKCAALPSVIKHQDHRHPLIQFRDENYKCNGCDCTIRDEVGYRCESCKYHIELKCAMLPATIKHRWGKHPLPLRFSPHTDHHDFMCDMCEGKEIDPNLWIYYSTQSDIYFHPHCIPRVQFPNVKFGGMVEVSSHSHPLKFVRKATLKVCCDDCGVNMKWPYPSEFRFECEDCNFCICLLCLDDSVL